MAAYIYKLKDDTGKVLWGFMEADNKKDLKHKLRSSHFYFIASQRCRPRAVFHRAVDCDTLLMFTHRLASLIGAGIPIVSAMHILWRQTEDHTLQLIISHLRRHLEEGNKVSEAMRDFPRVFPPMYRALIAIAEKSGGLVAVLEKLTEYLQYQKQVMTRIKKASLYPAIVVVFSILVLTAMFVFVVPVFQQVLGRLHVELPVLTRAVLEISRLLKTWYVSGGIILAGLALALIYRVLRNDPACGYLIDSYKLRLPVIGPIFYTVALSRFVRALSILMSAGLPILESFEAAKTTAVNRRLVSAINRVQQGVEQGGSLHDAFKEVRMFPIMLIEMVGIGESGGTLADVFQSLAAHLDEEVDYKLNHVLTLLEPALIIMVGGVVIVTLLAVYMPIFTIWQTLAA